MQRTVRAVALAAAVLGSAQGAHLRFSKKSLAPGYNASALFIQGRAHGTSDAKVGSAQAQSRRERRAATGVDAEMSSLAGALLRRERGTSVAGIFKHINGKMTVDDAVQRLGERLPKDVAALVKVNDLKHYKANFSEESLQKARKILNSMVEKSQDELDDIIIDCEEFKAANRRTFDQVVTDLARLGSDIAEEDENIAENLHCIADQDAEFKSASDTLAAEQTSYLKTRADNDAELTLKKNDLAVFNFIMDITKCREGSPGNNGTLFAQVGQGQSHPMRVCTTHAGSLELDFHNQKLQARLDSMMTPAARLAFRTVLGVAFVPDTGRKASSHQGRSLLQTGRGLGTNNVNLNANADLCIGAKELEDGAEVDLVACSAEKEQQLVFTQDDSLRIRDDPNMCITAESVGKDAKLTLAECAGKDEQLWDYHPKDKTIRSKKEEKYCIDVQDGEPMEGTPLVLSECPEPTSTQEWGIPASAGACVATVYEKEDYSGWQASYAEGEYDERDFLDRGAKQTKIGAVRVSGACKVILYQHSGFTGNSAVLEQGEFHQSDLVERGILGGNVSALKLERVATTDEPTITLPPVAVKESPQPEQQWKKCTDGKVNCGLLHDTMSLQWGKFKDLVDQLQAEMDHDRDEWEKLKGNINDQLKVIAEQKGECQTKFDQATGTKNQLIEERNEKDDQHHDLTSAYEEKMESCHERVEEVLFTDICAVRTVRNQVMRSSSVSPPAAITDCEVADWVAEPCSVDCDDSCPHMVGTVVDPYSCGGSQELNRKPIVQANEYGIKCPPFTRKMRCSQFKCSVDCALSEWSGWSKCTKECEGGAQQMTRSIMTKPKHGGKSCEATVETRACNTMSCDRDCSLDDWAAWSPCSMACNPGDMPGFQERGRSVLVPIRGEGKCPLDDNPTRYQKQTCNNHACRGDEVCIAQQDLIIAIDASGSIREKGFRILRDFAANMTIRYKSRYLGLDTVRIGVILFGNGQRQADDSISPAINVIDLTDDLTQVAEAIKQTKWQKGFTNMAQAFVLAGTMLQSGGRAEAQSSIIMLSDGKYSFAFETEKAVEALKEKNTLIHMAPVASRPGDWEEKIKEWSSQPWETNYELIPGFTQLENNMETFAGALIAKFCSDAVSPTSERAEENEQGYMLIREGGLPDDKCASSRNMGQVDTVADCRNKAEQEAGAFAFAVGTQKGKPELQCYAEAMNVTPALWTTWQASKADIPCPGGSWLENPVFDVYVIQPVA